MHAMRSSAHGTTDTESRSISSEFPQPSPSKNLGDSPVQVKEDTCLAGLGQQVTKKKGKRCNRRNAAATQRMNTENDLELEAQRLHEANQQLEHDNAMMRLQMRTMRRQHQQHLHQLQREADDFVDQLAKMLEAPRKAQ
uniref:BZIP domain-containing protein n=1 Tax=Eutreptiella gymnastica TaxID=73025 RepID=A0A6T2E558_9EUGL|eukprot:CAMPEP_0174375062 /NCGR_PEP_ID=MMETSP0811_2-20130205/113136_1 /TAXON_ID=73025 ORGANISM="Eutreptiella gymnastica-like, Strain CCMP1594" /NCGR_SAMPLE_ID=MMETSP0811_2 /ASSEMBLY_ACC=CAM_ASM_000667 /LENGTH=138 /DNA_ID=CAMNT_0015524909 /DNA_START=25 /DNA_END=441 /DNA_ORIENTATION=+